MSVNFAYLNTFGGGGGGGERKKKKENKSPYNICRISYDVCTHFNNLAV